MYLTEALKAFLLASQANGNRPATLRWYESLLGNFIAFYGDCDLRTVTTKSLQLYFVELNARDATYINAPQKPVQKGGLSHASIESYKRALHRFWAWCADEYGIPNPMKGIKRVKRRSNQPKAIHPQDFVKLFNATLDNDAGVRDRAMLAFFADTGCRLGGMLSLTLDNLYLEQREAVVIEKGGNSRRVFFTQETAHLLAQWLQIREAEGRFVFTRTDNGDPLTESGVNQILKRLKQRAGVKGRVNPHPFRHCFAREYLRNGGDLATLSKILGHRDMTTTASYYAIFTEGELAEFHDKYSPLPGFGVSRWDGGERQGSKGQF